MTLGLLAAGARVAATELDAQALDQTMSVARDVGADDRILDVTADVTRDDSGPQVVRKTIEKFGRLDILLNNAGINIGLFRSDGQPVGKFWEVTPAEFRRIMEVNVFAAFLMTRAAVPSMLAQRWGRIINVTTSLDTMWRGGMQPYGGSKAANEAHLLAMAQELEGTGVTANVLVPGGAADTRMVTQAAAPDRSKLDRARGDGGAAGLALLERVRWRHRSPLHRRAVGQQSRRPPKLPRKPARRRRGSSSDDRRSCRKCCRIQELLNLMVRSTRSVRLEPYGLRILRDGRFAASSG